MQFLQDELNALINRGLKRSLQTFEGVQAAEIHCEGRTLINFCSNNYLGLADDPRLVDAAKKSLDREGFGSASSRLVCGSLSSHGELEEKIAEFKQCEAALVFSTGYMANVGIISSLFGRDDIIFSDRLNHASIVDGILLSKAEFKRYHHVDMDHLEKILKESSEYKKRCIVTDSVFSMDGDIAPLDKIVALAKQYQCMVMIDEAHAFGVMGRHGRGVAEHFGVEKDIDIQMGTLSKAAGSFGAYVCGARALIDYLINNAGSFIYTTAMPPSVAAASKRAVEIIKEEPDRRAKLWANTEFVLKAFKRSGFNTLNTQTPIIPLVIGDSIKAGEFSKLLFDEGILIKAIRPPTVPVNTSRLRISIMATHSQRHLEMLIEQINRIGTQLCLI